MNRLRAVRELEGWTQHELSEMLGVSPQLISAVERGSRPLTFSITPTGYDDRRFTLPDMSAPLHRQRVATKVTHTHRAKELLRVAGELFIELRNRNPQAPRLRLQPWPTPMSLDEVETLAIEVRLLLSQEESGPIRNLTAVIERGGIGLIPFVGLPGIDGMSAWIEDQPMIGLSPAVSGDRFRFSMAHELAHLLFHKSKGKLTEDQANRFAGALLIPQEDLALALHGSPILSDFIGLKSSTGLSVGALVYRAHELGHLDDGRYRSLQIQMAKWRKNEPGGFPPIVGSLLPRMVEEAGGVMKVSSDLGMRWQHIREVTNWSSLRAA